MARYVEGDKFQLTDGALEELELLPVNTHVQLGLIPGPNPYDPKSVLIKNMSIDLETEDGSELAKTLRRVLTANLLDDDDDELIDFTFADFCGPTVDAVERELGEDGIRKCIEKGWLEIRLEPLSDEQIEMEGKALAEEKLWLKITKIYPDPPHYLGTIWEQPQGYFHHLSYRDTIRFEHENILAIRE